MIRGIGRYLIVTGALLMAGAAGFGLFGAWLEARDRSRFVESLAISPALPSVSRLPENLGVFRVYRLGWSVLVRSSASESDLSRGLGGFREPPYRASLGTPRSPDIEILSSEPCGISGKGTKSSY